MPPIVETKMNPVNIIKNDKNSSASRTLYSRICEIQPLDLLHLLEKEGISARGDMPGLRARLLRHELRRHYPETEVALHKDLDLMGREAENWCAMMNLWEIDTRARLKMKEQQQRSCSLIVDRKQEDPNTTKKPLDQDTSENKRTDYLLSCVKLLKSWNLQYSGARGQSARDFLEALKDFRKFANISDKTLLLMLPSSLTGEAKTWYRSKNFSTWDEFEMAFIQRVTMCIPPALRSNSIPLATKPSLTPNNSTPSPNIRTNNVEARMSQSFSFGSSDATACREMPKKIEQDQSIRPQLSSPSSLRTPHTSKEAEEESRRRLLEHELHRARYIGYLQQSRLNCMKERFQPHNMLDIQAKRVDQKILDNTSSIVSKLSIQLDCVKKMRLWNLKYTGEKGHVVIEFLEDLNDFRKWSDMKDQVIFDVLPCVLFKNAKRWYRNPSLLKKKWTCWREFEEDFLQRFYDSDAVEECLTVVLGQLSCRRR